uniref:CAF1B/HIR1 beta-propeller domain-containing protein n=1 Tax=Amphora coffeiformis TaxID=265554 RepID=A0A7S3P4R1_9STRA
MWSVPPEKRGNGNGQHFWSQVTREQDLHVRVIARSMEAVTDLSWSKDSQRLLAGAIDAAVFVLQAREDNTWHNVYRAKEHSHYVQGVAYDPLGVYFASMSNDRTVRVYTRKSPSKSKKKVQRKDAKQDGPIPSAEFSQRVQQLLNDSKLEMQFRTKQIKHLKQQAGESTVKQTLFCDEATLQSFFRRLDWTPDGAFLVLPACLWPKGTGSQPLDSATVNTPVNETPAHAVCIFARHHWEEPFRVLTGLEKPAVAIACNPVLFRLPKTDQENQPRAKMPYRSVMAVLTQDSVLIYDTVHTAPLAVMRGLHYANLTNAVWSADGQSLVVSSTDGYLSLVRFGPGELGEVYVRPTEHVATEAAVPAVAEAVSCSVPPAPAPTMILPPCEQGTTTVLDGRPAKKAKRITPTCIKRKTDDIAVPSVQDLSLVEPKKKKRIQPTLLMTTSQQ